MSLAEPSVDSGAPLASPGPASPSSLSAPQPPGNLDRFVERHVGPRPRDLTSMLEVLGHQTLDELSDAAVPPSIRLRRPLNLPEPISEALALAKLKSIASRNQVFRSYLGLGYYDCLTPPVIQRNVLENPGWYTQYTPYQAEISQGRLEGLLNFQTMVTDLTGMDMANASLLDEATAAAEAMTLCLGQRATEERRRFVVAAECFPQTLAVLATRAGALGIEITCAPHDALPLDDRVFGVLIQSPAADGRVRDLAPLMERAHAVGALVIVATDLLSLTLVKPPGEDGADVVLGSAQRFGVPLGFGGPHAAFLATRDAFKRFMPGRLVGVSRDSRGRPALRLALQTREQHIRREKATSNICTAQALLANMAALYAIYHGPEGLRAIAARLHHRARLLRAGASQLGLSCPDSPFFDTVTLSASAARIAKILETARQHRINVYRPHENAVTIALDETTQESDLIELLEVLNDGQPFPMSLRELERQLGADPLTPLARSTAYLQHPVFHRYRSETEMLRYLKRLEARDLSLTASMIPLGSCTMKLNATVEMLPVTWPEFSQLHPFAPADQTAGYRQLFADLETWLAEITGFAAVSLQPNAGSQGEYTGLLVIRRYQEQRGQPQRNVCLIPTSAHGTNPASAVMAGFKVVAVACDAAGNIDLADLRRKAAQHDNTLAAVMVTYPSTHGVFEESIRELCHVVHEHGGQVYMDGANLNAQVGLCRPGDMGADVCHLNLHKTFCIPHGGGGPGMGPIAVAAHLGPYLPAHPLVALGGPQSIGPVSAAPWGSPSILPISWIYIVLMGAAGLRTATQVALLNANYLAFRLDPYFPVLYRGQSGRVAHECILDLRRFKSVTVEDVAKRLMDYGFHAPTVSWPVPGTMMVEPTESESREELDRFCEAMIAIHAEILQLESGAVDPRDNVLKNAPHTADMLATDPWNHPYSRQQAAFPVASLRDHKYWPPVGRIDNVYGDRHPVCTCRGMEDYAT